MTSKDAADRCADFITDIVEVCKKHRVTMEHLDHDLHEDPVTFHEHCADAEGFRFTLDASDLEDAIRREVWPVIYPAGE